MVSGRLACCLHIFRSLKPRLLDQHGSRQQRRSTMSALCSPSLVSLFCKSALRVIGPKSHTYQPRCPPSWGLHPSMDLSICTVPLGNWTRSCRGVGCLGSQVCFTSNGAWPHIPWTKDHRHGILHCFRRRHELLLPAQLLSSDVFRRLQSRPYTSWTQGSCKSRIQSCSGLQLMVSGLWFQRDPWGYARQCFSERMETQEQGATRGQLHSYE